MPEFLDRLFETFRDVPKPHDVSGCDCPFCITTDDIRRLLDADQRTLTLEALLPYVANVLGTVGGSADFAYLLPAILRVWASELYRGDSAYNQRLHPALRQHDFLDRHLSARHREAVITFMCDTLLDRISRERSLEVSCEVDPNLSFPPPQVLDIVQEMAGALEQVENLAEADPDALVAGSLKALEGASQLEDYLKQCGIESHDDLPSRPATYGWFSHVASHGVVTDDVPALWQRWWSLPSEGCAVAAVQYASVLVCDEGQNPVFPPWTENAGGGPPVLWEYESLADEECWQVANVSFLSETLSIAYLEDRLRRARDMLGDTSRRDKVSQVLHTLELEPWRAEQRIPRLIELLAAPHGVLETW